MLVKDVLAAPCAIYGRDDFMNRDYLASCIRGYKKGSPDLHHIPSAEGIVNFALAGLAYALLPEISVGRHLRSGKLVDLLPDKPYRLPLFWQTQGLQTETTRAFSKRIVSHAQATLE